MKTTLLIMAAGIGSRYGAGIKQLAEVDDAGHIIMDYSVHDAIEAGFNKIIFVIRKDIETDFREVIGHRIEAICKARGVDVDYAFQELNDLPAGFAVPEGRSKPWGTGQAVLAAKDLIREPFAVINADDYYGKESFVNLHEFLTCQAKEDVFCMAGFILKNTLSEHGGVTRGICQVNADGYLTDVVETRNIMKTPDGAMANGTAISVEANVSMNMWGLIPQFLDMLERGFIEFLGTEAKSDPLKSEYLLPIYIGQLLRENKVSVKMLETTDQWFGITYPEDKALVVQNFRKLIDAGVYQDKLYGAE